jgi:iron complex transport system substrate-binding protein
MATGIAALALALALLVPARADAGRAVVDGAGRRVEVPDRVARVYPAGGPASILVHALAPDRLIGWTRALVPAERAFITAPYRDLPELGRLTGRGNTANVEGVIAAQPSIILDYGTVGPTYASLADRVQQQTGVPYLLLDGGVDAIPAASRLLGALLDAPERGEALARYAEAVIADVGRRVAQVPAARRPRVYYARGPRGLETAARGAINVESLERLGARNVAPPGGGLLTVSFEQVAAWDPDVVIAVDPAFHASTRTDPLWRTLRAVREGRVYRVPLLPFPWIDAPPSVNRLLGLRWLGQVLYPALFPEDLRRETRDFYQRVYHRAPDERQLDALLAGQERRQP